MLQPLEVSIPKHGIVFNEILLLDKIPVLGSGKTDYVGATELAKDRAAAKAEAKADSSGEKSAAA